MDFTVFDTKKMDEYAKRAKEQWGKTAEYKEFEEKSKGWTDKDQQNMANDFMQMGARNSLRKQLKSTAEDKYNECSKFVAAVKRYLLLAEVGKAR